MTAARTAAAWLLVVPWLACAAVRFARLRVFLAELALPAE